jgi:hypothetical protein
MSHPRVDESPEGEEACRHREKRERTVNKALMVQYQTRLKVYSICWRHRQFIDGYQPLTLKDISVTL